MTTEQVETGQVSMPAAEDVELRSFSVRVPAGDYAVGDPCYEVDDVGTLWSDCLQSSNYFRSSPLAASGDVWFVAGNTRWGDGAYAETISGATVTVDSGLIGLVPLEPGAIRARGMTQIHLPAGGRFTRIDAGTFTVTDPNGNPVVHIATG